MRSLSVKRFKTACRSMALLLGLLLLGSCHSDLTRYAGDNARKSIAAKLFQLESAIDLDTELMKL